MTYPLFNCPCRHISHIYSVARHNKAFRHVKGAVINTAAFLRGGKKTVDRRINRGSLKVENPDEVVTVD